MTLYFHIKLVPRYIVTLLRLDDVPLCSFSIWRENKHISLSKFTFFLIKNFSQWKPQTIYKEMTPEQKGIIRINEPQLVRDIMPTDLLCWLACLTDEDQEVIMAEERNYGPTRAARILLDRLKRRSNSFGQLVRALRENTLGHLAALLDPNNEGILIFFKKF